MSLWIRNTRGRPDALLTFSLLAVLAALAKFLANGVVLSVAGRTIALGTVDASLLGAVLVPTLGAYTAKRLRGGRNDEAHPADPGGKP